MPRASFTATQLASSPISPLHEPTLLVQEKLANVNAPFLSNALTTSLTFAIRSGNVDMALFLLDHGADVYAKVTADYTLLMFSCMDTRLLPVTRKLVEMGSDVAHRSSETGHTALVECILNGCLEQAQLLLEAGAPVDQPFGGGGNPTPLALALIALHEPLIRLLVEHGADLAMALHYAARKGLVADVTLFLQLGADPNHRIAGCTPLMAATITSDLPQETAVEIAHMLIKAGADVDATDNEMSAFSLAVKDNRVEMAQLLLQAGADKTTTHLSLAGADPAVVHLLSSEGGGDNNFEFDEKLGFEFTLCTFCRRNQGVLDPCAGCIMVAYCNEECQCAHWLAHKPICKKKREMKEKRRRQKSRSKEC